MVAAKVFSASVFLSVCRSLTLVALKSEYSSDGLHIFDAEGINTLVDNIKNGILSSGAVASAETLESGTGRAGYAIVVANRKDVYTTVTDTYEYASSYTVEKANGHEDVILLATGSEVDLAVKTKKLLLDSLKA